MLVTKGSIVSQHSVLNSRCPLNGVRNKKGRNQVQSTPLQVLQTPHSGYHYDGTARRFFEGWYWRVQIPNSNESFAIMYSIEDPHGSDIQGVGVQVMGLQDGYICQYMRDTRPFWADSSSLTLGAVLRAKEGVQENRFPKWVVPEPTFDALAAQGFQASSTFHQGSIIANESGAGGPPQSTVETCRWTFKVAPVTGWGNGGRKQDQKATAGWLSALSVFEPHWQVLMSHGLASGWLEWGTERVEFTDAPCYAEKNWGGGFPSKWCWLQCNSFDGFPGLSVTAVGARRALLVGLPGVEEDVGMIGITYGGELIELVPWTGEVEWEAAPWGTWSWRAESPEYVAELEASCAADAGTLLRAPTAKQGLAFFCKDTFFGKCRLRIWRKSSSSSSVLSSVPLVDASSSTAALEVGGGPWWSPWKARAQMLEPMRTLVQLPIDVAAINRSVPPPLRLPGL